MRYWRIFRRLLRAAVEGVLAPGLLLMALVARFVPKRFDVGLGPEPLINNVYHKQALVRYGYRAQTFAFAPYYITAEFDIRADRLRLPVLGVESALYGKLVLFVRTLFCYRCVYIYFNGGVLGLATRWLWRLEPWLYKLARVKVVVMPYGSDVTDTRRMENLPYKHALLCDYPDLGRRAPRIAAQVALWTRHADHVIAGCDWVDYLPYWDTLMLAHFSIDTQAWRPGPAAAPLNQPASGEGGPLRILHAPNHRTVKGTRHLVEAVAALQAEGLPVELIILERQPNAEVKRVMASVDLVADQFIVGWYAMFALEAMAMGKPVLCYLRPDLEALYTTAGLVAPGAIPIINCTAATIAPVLRRLLADRAALAAIGQRARAYVCQHHSTEAVGAVFDRINRRLMG